MISIFAILSTLALVLSMMYQNIKTFCDENNISYDITFFHLGRTFSKNKSQTVNTDAQVTNDRAE